MTTTDRLLLPLLAAGQAQKEMTHNEALAALDLAVQASVVAVGRSYPPADPAPGQCWAVGAAPGGAWTGQAGAIAGWTGGGWRFVAARPGLSAWSVADAAVARWTGAAWRVGSVAPVATPAGGSVVDVEARAALAGMLAALRSHGLLAEGT